MPQPPVNATLNPLESVQGYHAFLAKLDGILTTAWERYQGKMQCKAGCFSCCRADFKVSIIEGVLVKQAVSQLPNETQTQIQQNLAQPAPNLCPLLIDGQCSIYQQRPVLCRIFGFPVSDGNTIATCELNFTEDRQETFTAECFDTKVLAESTQAFSKLYLLERGQTVPEDTPLPMFTITEILK